MGKDNDRPDPADSGRKGYREPGEALYGPDDKRPTIVYTSFGSELHKDAAGRIVEEERETDDARWEAAARKVMGMPDFESMTLFQKLELMVQAAGGRKQKRQVVKSIPRPLMSEKAFNDRMEMLRKQAHQIAPEQREIRLPYREPGDDE